MINEALFNSNLAAIRQKSQQLADSLAAHEPTINCNPVGSDVHLMDGERILRGEPYLAYEQRMLSGHLSNPSRLLNIPAKYDKKIEAEQHDRYLKYLKPVKDEFALTQCYDDAEGALHTGFFTTSLAKILDDKVSINDTPIKNNPYYLMVWGLGLGSFLPTLIESYKPRHIIICEDNLDFFYWSLHFVDWSKIFEDIKEIDCKISFVVHSDWQQIHGNALTLIGNDNPLSIDGVISWYSSESSNMLRAFRNFGSGDITKLTGFTGFTVDEFNMVKNSFRNLSLGTGKVIGPFKYDHDVPVIIVASGPSLDEMLPWIKDNNDKIIVITCGSSLPALIKYGVTVDYQLIIERDKYMYTVHTEDIENGCDYSNTRCIASSTIWPGLSSYFSQTYWFFRAALTPLSIFGSDFSEVIQNDGPQTVNLGLSVAQILNAKNAYLLGVDLGAASKFNPRASNAHGLTVRELNLPVRGNFGRTVFTDTLLVSVRTMLESFIKSSSVKFFNMSNGVKIEGAESGSVSEIEISDDLISKKKELLAAFDAQMPLYTKERFDNQWYSHDLRTITYMTFKQLKDVLCNFQEWNHDIVKWIFDFLNYNTKNMKDQILPRLIRGDIMRWVMDVDNAQRRCATETDRDYFLEHAKKAFLVNLDKLEAEIYSLFDELEYYYDK